MACSPVGFLLVITKARVSIPSKAWIFFRFFLKLLGEDHIHFHNTWYSVSWYYMYNTRRCVLSFHLLILPHHFQSHHFPAMRVDLLISVCVSYLGVQPTISHVPSSAKSEATPQHQMTHFLNSLGCKN